MRNVCLSVFLVALTVIAGCGGGSAKPSKREPVFKVQGKVTYKGKPVAGADVTFRSESVERSAFGRTDDQGNYKLSTFGANDGAVAGKHSVVIIKGVAEPAKPEAPVESAEYVPPGYEKVKPQPKAKSDFPEKYSKPATSGLLAIVNDDGKVNQIDFELND